MTTHTELNSRIAGLEAERNTVVNDNDQAHAILAGVMGTNARNLTEPLRDAAARAASEITRLRDQLDRARAERDHMQNTVADYLNFCVKIGSMMDKAEVPRGDLGERVHWILDRLADQPQPPPQPQPQPVVVEVEASDIVNGLVALGRLLANAENPR